MTSPRCRETVSGVRVVKGFGAERVQQARFRTEVDQLFDESIEATRVRSVFLPTLEMLPNIGLILVLAYGGHQVINGSLSLGSLVAFNVYVVMFIWPLRMLGMILAQAQRAVASSQRVHEVLVAEPQVIDAPHAAKLPKTVPDRPTGELRFETVTFRYPGGSGPARPRRARSSGAGRRVGRTRRAHRQRQEQDDRPVDPTVL